MVSTYLLRLAQAHETFRRPEIEALAELNGVRLQWLYYSPDSPFAIIAVDNDQPDTAKHLIARSILCLSIHELWGRGTTYDALHSDVRDRTASLRPQYKLSSFRFELDTFQVSQSAASKNAIVESFSYLAFGGPVVMKRPDNVFTVFEDYELNARQPRMIFFGRWLADSGRKLINQYDLKKRKYIATTSMDAELSLLTANLALAAPGKLAYDPFMATGSFPVSCAAYGAITFGSDLDGRSIRGKGARNVASNFLQYGTQSQYLGGCAADLTNSPIAARPILDIIVCDPPYGVREGLKVLGHIKESLQHEIILNDGTPAHLQKDYIPPKKPYSFTRMLDDVLDFSAIRLVDHGRLCMWMPVAGAPEDSIDNDKDSSDEAKSVEPVCGNARDVSDDNTQEYMIPQHPCLKLVGICQQDFNKWSRRLLIYSRLNISEVDVEALTKYHEHRRAIGSPSTGKTRADDLNDFRRQYFQGFRVPST